MTVNIENKMVEGVIAFAKVLTPVKKYQKENEYELTIDIIVSEDDAEIWDDNFKKQPARTVKTADFENIFKIEPPFPDQKKQYIVKLKRDTTYKDGNEVPKDYWPKIYQQVGTKRINLGDKLEKRNVGIANGSKGKVSFEVTSNDFGTFARLKNILITELIEFEFKTNDGSEFGGELDDGADEFDTPKQEAKEEKKPSTKKESKKSEEDEDAPF